MAYRNIILTNFAAGEASPLVEARVDVEQYAHAVKELTNFIVLPQGCARKRPGTREIKDMGTHTYTKLIPFSPSSTDNYILLFAPGTIYIFKNGAQLRTYPVTKSVTSITRTGNIATATVTSHGYAESDYVQIAGANQTDYNGIFQIANITTNTFEYIVQNSPATPATGTITSAVGVGVTIANVYNGADFANIRYAQKNDVLYLTHNAYAPRKISRASDTSWSLSTITFDPPPTYEDVFNLSINKSVTSITHVTTTATATVTAHGFIANNYITISGATPSQYNGTFVITNVTANTFDYTMLSDPGADATGTIVCSGATLKPYATSGESIVFVAGDNIFSDGDIGRTIIFSTAQATINSSKPITTTQALKAITSITRSGTTATATVTAHGYSNGDKIVIIGAEQTDYNGTFPISNVAANTFDYTVANAPTTPATGDALVCYKPANAKSVTSITRSGTIATATVTAHGYANDDYVDISGANQSEYNGRKIISNVEANTFDYTVSGSPATPATGTMHAELAARTNVVVADILVNFPNTNVISAGSWTLSGSPQAEIEFDAKGPAGAVVGILADNYIFNSLDIGRYIKTLRGDGSNAIFIITKVTQARRANAKVVVPLQTSDSATIIANAWSLEIESWSATRGYPAAITFFEDRVFYGGSTAQPSTIWGSESGGYENFADGSKDDDAITRTLNTSGLNNIIWLFGARSLLAGTPTGEWRIEGTSGKGITPDNAQAKNDTPYGSNNVNPVRVANEILFMQRTGEKIRALVYDFDSDGYLSPDLTIFAEHITSGGIVDMAYQQEKHSLIWLAKTNGNLLSLAYNKEHKTIAWSEHDFIGQGPAGANGLVKNVAVIPHPDGNRDQVWLVVKRGTDYHIDIFEDGGYYGDIQVDNAFVYSGASISKIIGLARFNTKTVNIVVNGLKQAAQVVSNGTVDISPAGTKVEIGLAFTSTLKTLRPEIQTETGSRQGKKVRWSEILVRLDNTIKLKIEGTDVDSLTNSLFTGDVRVANLGWDRDGYITITHDEPYPCTILGIIGNLEYAD